MKYFVIVIIMLGLGASWYWWRASTSAVGEEPIVNSAETVEAQATSTTEAGEKNIYRNEKWGIAFEYPVGWEVIVNEINSNSSLFNVVLQTNDVEVLPRPIYILFSTNEWGENLVQRYYNQESGSRQILGGIDAYTFPSSDMGILTKVHLLPISDTYWINIVGKTGYETELNQVLESLTVTPVEVEVKD